MKEENDDIIARMFEGFNPTPHTDDDVFVERLTARLDEVEFIRRRIDMRSRHYRTSVAVAGIAGFLAGCVVSVILNICGVFASEWTFSLPGIMPSADFAISSVHLAWVFVIASSVFAAFPAYESSMAFLENRRRDGDDSQGL